MPEHSEFMFIGAYQLQNLIEAQAKFAYFDLSKSVLEGALLRGAIRIAQEENQTNESEPQAMARAIDSQMQESQRDRSFPILLICEKGDRSVAVAKILAHDAAAPYLNIFVVEGGQASLLPE